jgi:hypothetical protein
MTRTELARATNSRLERLYCQPLEPRSLARGAMDDRGETLGFLKSVRLRVQFVGEGQQAGLVVPRRHHLRKAPGSPPLPV